MHSSPEQQASAAQDSQWREMRAVRVVRRHHPQRERNKHALGARDSRHTSGHSHTDMCRAATLEGVTARALLAIALAASSLACTALPSVTFVSDDASSGDGATSVDSAAPPSDATLGEASALPDSSGETDSAPPSDAGPPPSDSGPACPPAGAPAGTLCCANGTPCIGPACSICNECNCAVGLYCCAKENGGGHVQGTICSSAPTSSQCPTQ